MKNVIQGETIEFKITFYNVEPALGGVPTDPDGFEHSWNILNDAQNRVSNIVLLESGGWPTTDPLYFAIIDSGTDFEVKGYLNAADHTAAINEIVTTGTLSYGVFVAQALNEANLSGYSGTISITFPGVGGGQEDFEIEDGGQIEPTYEIHDENNTIVVASTVFPTREDVGLYSTTYDVVVDAPPGENWRLIARAKIGGIDTFIEEYFRVVDAAVAEEENAMLVTLSEVKTRLNIETDSEDQNLLALIVAASGAIEEWTGQRFHVTDESIYFNGYNIPKTHIDEGPINGVTKIEDRDVNGNWSENELTNFQFSEWFLERIDGGVFDEGANNWRMTYTRGYDKAPAQVRKGVIALIRQWRNMEDRTGIVSDVVGGGLRVNYDEIADTLPTEVKQIVRAYRRCM